MRLALHGHAMIHGSKPKQTTGELGKNAFVSSSGDCLPYKDDIAGAAKR